MGRHEATETGHVGNEERGSDRYDPEIYRREDAQGWAVGRVGKPDNYTDRPPPPS
jgi:hypothetical protein